MSSAADWLAASARRVPDREALRAQGTSWTFAELDAFVSGTVRKLQDAGLRPGDRVASLLPNGALAAALPLAALRLGATLVPINTRLSQPEIDWQLAHCRPRLVVSGEAQYRHGDSAVQGRPHEAEYPLAIIYTSGTTGLPRGAMLTADNFWHSAQASARNLGVRDDDRWLAVLPLFHVGGLSIVLRSAIYGTGAVVHKRFDAAAVNRAIDVDGVTLVSLVAVLVQQLLDDRGDRPFPPTLRAVLAGGGPVPVALLERCARAGLPVIQTYGLTEAASQVATLAPADALRKIGSAGQPLPGTELRIDGAPEGEILVRGPTVMAGYLDDPAATAAALKDGWLHTGDIGRLDDEGFLYVLDRRDDLIVSGGENVYPAEVEAALLGHPTVEEAAVIGSPDETWGYRVVAVVRFKAGQSATPYALIAHCRERLAGYKVPREVRVAEAPLPRTASGKLRRSLLR